MTDLEMVTAERNARGRALRIAYAFLEDLMRDKYLRARAEKARDAMKEAECWND